MTAYYYYIEAGAVIDTTTTIYVVPIGSSKAGQSQFLRILAHSVDHNHYFRIKDGVSSTFVHNIITETPLPLSCMQLTTPRDLIKHFRDNVAIPLNPAVLKNHHYFQDLMKGSYHFSNRLPKSANA